VTNLSNSATVLVKISMVDFWVDLLEFSFYTWFNFGNIREKSNYICWKQENPRRGI